MIFIREFVILLLGIRTNEDYAIQPTRTMTQLDSVRNLV
jgi:hypothetical protein